MGALFGEITARAVSSGNTTASKQAKTVSENPIIAKNNEAIWKSRTFDTDRSAKRDEMKKKALFNFSLAVDYGEDENTKELLG